MIPEEFWRIAQWLSIIVLCLAAAGCVAVVDLAMSLARRLW